MGLFNSIGDFLSGGNQSAARDASAASIAALQGLETPDVEQMRLELEGLVQQGVLSPEQAQVYLQDKSEMNNISLDPKLKQAQMDALTSLQDISSQGGLTASDRARLGDIKSQEDAQARGAREAIIQNAESRGMGGSGISLLAQLQNQQDSATRASQRDLDVAGMAQDRALQALQSAGQLGGQIGQQEFGQQAQIAGANDAIAQFNARNKQDVANMNTQANNQAMAANLAEKQRIADTNVGQRNTQQQYNKQLAQQDFENKYKKAGGVANAYQNQAQNYNQAGQQITGLLGAGIQAAGAYAGATNAANIAAAAAKKKAAGEY